MGWLYAIPLAMHDTKGALDKFYMGVLAYHSYKMSMDTFFIPSDNHAKRGGGGVGCTVGFRGRGLWKVICSAL